VLAGLLWEDHAHAQALRLRADAVAETSSPAGLIVLQGQDKVRPWFDVEGLVWGGARPDATGDILVLALRLHDLKGRTELRAGRFVLSTGAVRPVQLDGAKALARLPFGATVELFGGAPVVPRFATAPYDWLAGGRVAQSIGHRVTAGVSYVQRRSHAELANEEVGADLTTMPLPWLDIAGRGAYDLTSPGVAEAILSAAARTKKTRFELFAQHRSPGRLLPATSLFSVLGDFASESVGATVLWKAAPRLDLLASAAGQQVGQAYGGNAWVRSTLRLDDLGAGYLGLEVRRQDVSTAKWTGVRAVASIPIVTMFRFSTELEVALPDEPAGRGVAWPWGLMALSWRHKGWETAAAVEAGASPQNRYEVNGLLRLSRTLELP
jgi:hypothetical protein